MTLIKTSILTAISTIIRVIAGFISIKIIAVYVGPSGLALMGQLQSFITMMSSIASALVKEGIVKYTAENYDDEGIKQKIWSSAFKISLVLVVPMSFLVIVFSDFISLKLFKTVEYGSVFILFAITVIFFVLNSFLLSILNGQKEIKKLTILNIIGSIFGLIMTVVLVIHYQLYGALIAQIISQSIVFFITLFFVLKSSWFKLNMFLGDIDKEYTKKLLKYSLMALVTATMIPLSHIYIRNYIGANIGWDEAGYWQAVWRISETYLMLVTVSLSVYYLPKLSSIDDKKMLRAELFYGYKIIMPIVVFTAFGIYIFKDFIIEILFTEKFSPMAELFLYQLIGDVIKIASWLMSFIMIAKAMTRMYILSEIFFAWSFVGLTILFMNIYGLIGVTIAFMVNYFIYLIFIYFKMKDLFSAK
jgi:PST family polysaccharide transporter